MATIDLYREYNSKVVGEALRSVSQAYDENTMRLNVYNGQRNGNRIVAIEIYDKRNGTRIDRALEDVVAIFGDLVEDVEHRYGVCITLKPGQDFRP